MFKFKNNHKKNAVCGRWCQAKGQMGKRSHATSDGLQPTKDANRRWATRQLLLFSRRQAMQSSGLDLNEVVTNLTKMLQRIIGEDVRLQLDLCAAPLMTRADVRTS